METDLVGLAAFPDDSTMRLIDTIYLGTTDEASRYLSTEKASFPLFATVGMWGLVDSPTNVE